MREYIPIGTRVRLKPGARTMSGWRGTATIIRGRGTAIKDGYTDRWGGMVDACPWQWAIMRNQTPNPEHAIEVAKAKGEPPLVAPSSPSQGTPGTCTIEHCRVGGRAASSPAPGGVG